MSYGEHTKFSPLTLVAKANMKAIRKRAGHKMVAGAALLGVSRKQLEDIETIRNYGCHIDLELIAKFSSIYCVPINELVGDLPLNPYADCYKRPRERVGPRE